MALLGSSDLEVSRLCLGGNVFGWTADRDASFAVLDAYLDAGGDFVDTADVYSSWVDGNSGGESETIIGDWLRRRSPADRDRVIVATKVGSDGGLAAGNVRACTEASLRRLGTDRIDLLYAHFDDADTPIEETLEAFDALVREGKVRHIAASNFSAERLAESLRTSREHGWAEYVALQPEYSLVHRDPFEGALQDLCLREGLGVCPYLGLARGFLTGKYRPGAGLPDSPRAKAVREEHFNERGWAVVEALDTIASRHGVTPSAIALAWLAAQPAVTSPIASATSVAQLEELLEATRIRLGDDDQWELEAASR